jgi:hypothetical protein
LTSQNQQLTRSGSASITATDKASNVTTKSVHWSSGNLYVTIKSMTHQIKELLLADGESPFAEWFGSLDAVAAAKVRVAVSRMEQDIDQAVALWEDYKRRKASTPKGGK